MAFSLPSSSSALSSSPLKWSYDVFLSFRGIDTRNTFTAFLYPALRDRGIKTYIDDKDLDRGETISPTLLKAIEESMISIIVLSPHYASSAWCLEELTKILECKKTKQQIVLPVFYRVNPSEVRNLRGGFEEALAIHQERFKEDPKVQRWKESLQEVAGLAGEHLEDGNEYEFMQKIIQWVDSIVVKSTYQLDIAEHLIGLESRLNDLNTKLEIGRNDITLMTGIYGTGGIGKTTLAKAVFNSIGHQFEARCFLANVREKSSGKDNLEQLQEQLLNELFGNFGSFNIGGVGGTNVIKRRLCSKRVLIILDDVSELCQLKELAGNRNWFGPGSRILITTRDQHLLTNHEVDSTYEVQGLDNNQAIQLFSQHAFKRDKTVESHGKLTRCIIDYAKGLPLALTVLGSYLHGRSIQEWESALEKYKRSPHKDIYEILKISYDGLDNNEKDIFLDIACFFKGQSIAFVTKILDSCHFSASIGIARLKEKCLINIQYAWRVEMHDLLQEMGKEIVREKSPKEAGECSRLWFHEDVRQVLEENTGTDKIEGILLDIPERHDDMQIRLHPEAFMNMRNLRLFINQNVQFFGGQPNYLSNEIRLLDWANYLSSFLPSNFRGNNLVEFQMRNSLIKELGGLKSKNLTKMDLSGCKSLTKIPNLSSCPNLKLLCLWHCENLVEIHLSVELGMPNSLITFKNLRYMNFSGCKSLTKFPDLSSCPNLEELDLSNCVNLVEVHDSVELGMPSSLITFKNLTVMNFSGCKSLTKFPDLSSCPNLEELDLSNCVNLVEVHDSVELGIPSSLITFKNLTVMNFSGCKSLTKIPDLSNCPNLERLDLSNCENLVEVHDSVELRMPNSLITFKNLKYMILSGCKSLTKISDLSSCPNLESLCLRNCENLEKVHDSVGFLDKFWNFSVGGCCKLRIFPKRFKLRSLIFLSLLKSFEQATECEIASNFFTNGNYFPALGRLDLSGIDIVIFPPQSVRFASLRYLGLDNCKKLEEILPLPLSIDGVTASGCTSLENFALLSEVLIKNNRTNISNFLRIEVNGCYKLLANMLPIPSWEERHSEERNREGRYIDIEFPGERIPSWFSYRKEAHDSNLCEIDINGPHHWNDIDEIVIYVVYGFRVGITNLEVGELVEVTVEIHDGSNWTEMYTKSMTFSRMVNSDHVWMLAKRYRKLRDVSRFRIKCDIGDFMVFRRVGIPFPKKHEENVRDEDHTGVLYETPFKDFWLDFMDDNENPKDDLELENDDENPKEGFGKRRRDEYDCNLEFNWYPQQKRQHSSTMGIRITELENDDEHPKEDMDLELKLG